MIVWEPHEDARSVTSMGRYMSFIEERFGIHLGGYDDLWAWSVGSIESFWSSLAAFLDVGFFRRGTDVLTTHAMPQARWFSDSTLNYAQQALAGPADEPVLESHSQTRELFTLTRGELAEQVARVRCRLVELGVEPGDRVAAFMPNIAETVAIFLAAASLGAVFVSCAPEFGVESVVDRLAQVGPKVLFVVDGYRFGSKVVDRVAAVASIRKALSSLEATVVVSYLDPERAAAIPDALPWSWVMEAEGDLQFAELPFDHPLCVLFSSGSTGPPKPIVHGHGGITLEHLKWLVLHSDIRPNDIVFWPTTTAWMTWNVGVSTLLCGARAILFDGDPTQPDLAAFWKLVGETKTTHLGVSPPLLLQARRAGVRPMAVTDLSHLRVLSSGGSPLSTELYHWVYDAISTDVMLASVSGGTDCCTAFVGGSPLLPVRAGEITCRFLGTKVEAFDDAGLPVIEQQGELVITQPIPSMPVAFWGDQDGSRLHAAYFERFPGVWCHGDWITISRHGTAVISGRSDATLNRGGVRMGTQEFYSVIEEIPSVSDSLVVYLEAPDGGVGDLVLFVSPAAGARVDEAMGDVIRKTLRQKLSPRYVPDEIIEVAVIPRTITGKRLEVPVKRILSGIKVGPEVVGSLADRNALDPFFSLADSRGPVNGGKRTP